MAEKLVEDSCLGLDETVDLAGMLSFPASDAPGWTMSHLGAPVGVPGAAQGPELLHDVVQRIRDDVHFFAETIGERNDASPRTRQNLREAALAIEGRFRDAGLPVKQRPADRVAPSNVEAVIVGTTRPSECVVIGAHYDSARGSPGADDDSSGLAALLALAHSLRETVFARTVRLVAFVDEELPHKRKPTMGSVRYVDSLLREGPTVSAMVSLEMLGVFANELPWPLKRIQPLRSDTLAFVGGLRSRGLVARARSIFERAASGIDVHGVNLPLFVPGVRASDHWSFARRGIPAFMVTDLGPLRTWRYHTPADTPRGLDFDRIGRASLALTAVVRELANDVPRHGGGH